MLVEPAQRQYRTWILDSRRWAQYLPRSDDVVIATYPKCGTTWMQRIVGLLIFQTPEPAPIMQISAWIDRRFPQPIEAVIELIEAQKHRRFLKSHLPLDGLPFYDDLKYIHVARDGRDACISFHNHGRSFTDEMMQRLSKEGMDDETIGRPYPNIPADIRQYFHQWITQGEVAGHQDGSPTVSFFHFENSWWMARDRPNVLFLHYNDLKSDLRGEMRRIADFLGISVAPDLWPQLVEAAGFDAMRRDGDTLLGYVGATFKEGARSFFFKGSNERWRDTAAGEDLDLYQAKVLAVLPPACASWVEWGRAIAGDPATA
jgi:aryl sulfotransferase